MPRHSCADYAHPRRDMSATASLAALDIQELGIVPYREAWELQRGLAVGIAAGKVPETVLLLEHPHTYTIGRRGGHEHLLATPVELWSRGAIVIESDRGGDITYHGPGQLVGYPLLDLRRRVGDIHGYLRSLERVLIASLAEYGLRGERESPHTGVWCHGAKVAAIGIKVSRGVTLHGFALNVNTDLSYFDLIVPCGIHGRQVTSMERLLGESLPMSDVASAVRRGLVASLVG